MQDSSKSIFASTTFWGALLTALAPVFKLSGIEVDPAALSQATATTLTDIISLVGMVVAIFGRWKATQMVHFMAPPADSVNQKGFMRLDTMGIMVVLAAVCVFVIACATTAKTPVQSVLVAEDSLIAATQSLSLAKGTLSATDYKNAVAVEKSAKVALFDMRTAARANDTNGYLVAVAAFNSAMQELTKYYAAKNAAGAASSTGVPK